MIYYLVLVLVGSGASVPATLVLPTWSLDLCHTIEADQLHQLALSSTQVQSHGCYLASLGQVPPPSH